jgi:FKBP-type peptidyl-prolyl cis-trans isomerase FkpA
MIIRILFFILLIGFSCQSEEDAVCTKTIPSTTWSGLDQTQLAADIEFIDNHLVANSKTATEDISGIRFTITEQGTGDTPCLESTIKVTYTGVFLSNSTEFDSGTGITFRLNNLIAGWRVAFLKFNRGTKATLYIPSGLAYGPNARTGIPANSNLIFFVELIDF